MKSKAIFVALLAFAFAARAARVSQSEAAGAASVWAGAGKAMGVRLGATVESVREYSITNGCSFYAVKLDGGTVIMTSDTALDPVVAFSARGDLDFSENGPLFNLLRRDVLLRSALAGAPAQRSATTSASTSASASAPASSSASSLWSALLRRQSAAVRSSPSSVVSASSQQPLKSISDVRVAPLVKSEWSQDYARGQKCYNYYTPKYYVCGCTATAMSQIMRYHEWPQAAMEPREYDCEVDGKAAKLTTQAGLYDWENMTLVPEKEELSEVNCQAIGKLTSDAGIAVKSSYKNGDTGASPQDVAAAFREAFGYPEAICYWNASGWNKGEGGLHTRELREKIVYANLDAGQPVQFAIYGYPASHIGDDTYWAGHAVVADGYGFVTIEGEETEYVHINMGWAGTDDMWYNIPEINAANSGAHAGDSGYDFLYLGGAVYNISPNASDAGLAILAGRLTDEDGEAQAGATVVAYDDSETVVGETVSDEKGIYHFKLPGNAAYSLFATSADGKCIAELEVDNLPATTGISTTYVVTDSSRVGNSWGNDMVLDFPSVRVGDEVFASVDSGIAKARELAETAEETPVIEILDATRLKKTQTIDFTCVLFATNTAPASSPVARRSDAQILVAPGVTLVMSNIVFASGSGTVVDVADGGRLALSGTVDFGVDYETAAVRTATATGFILYGGLLSGFVLDCAEAQGAGDTFGYAVTTDTAVFEAICASAPRIANFYDSIGESRGQLQGESPVYSLVWRDQQVPFEDSVGYYIDKDGATNTAARIDRLFDRYANALAAGDLGDVRRMVLRQGGTLSRPLDVADGLSLVGEDVAVTLRPTAGFTVTGGELAISGIAFSDYKGKALFLVNGDDAALSLGAGTSLMDIEGGSRITGTTYYSGAVVVQKGIASATDAQFVNCRTLTTVNSCGGAFYVAPGCSLALENCTITDCWAKNFGGAVYASTNSTVSLAGELHIVGNTQEDKKAASDIYLKNASNGKGRATLLVADAVSGAVGVRWQGPGGGYGNDEGLLAADAASAAVAHESSGVLFCNATTPLLVAEPDDEAVALRWTEALTGPQPWEGDPADASARVEYADGTEVYYLLVSEALEVVDGDATIWVQGWDGLSLNGDVTIAHNITLASDTDIGAYWLDRRADCSILVEEGGSLTLRDITLFGCMVTINDDGDMVFVREPTTTKPLINVHGGSLTLSTPSDGFDTEISCVFGDGARNAGAISVWAGGSFRMESGAAIRDCYNAYANEADGSGRGGALMVDDGTAVFEGGTIELCEAYTGGGVFIGNKGAVSISGDTIIEGNNDLDGELSDIVVYDQGTLTLAGRFTGSVGYVEGFAGDTEAFGVVAAGVSAADALASAHNFYHDWTGDIGMAVAGGGRTILVWSNALEDDGSYTDEDGVKYQLVAGDAYGVPVPAAEAGLVYNGEEQFGVEDDVGYTATGNSAVAAGEYTATLTLRPGFKWEDGSTGAKTVAWSIAKATYDMSGVAFTGATFTYSGAYYELTVEGDLPEGVSVSYENNRQREVGVYEAVASFTGDADNYEAISDMTATLEILAVEEPTPPGDDPPVYAQPKPIAFTAVAEADGSWTVSLTTAVERCWYTLYEADSLSGGLSPESATAVECRQATAADVPTMTFTIPAGAAQCFWRVVGEPENAH